ncbi:MAG: hypothetical protein AAGH15_13905 [Myxococcota bacterium]
MSARLAFVLALALGCGDAGRAGPGPADLGDAGMDPGDAGVDLGDAGRDLGVDAGLDLGADAGDLGVDAGDLGMEDAGLPDLGVDLGADPCDDGRPLCAMGSSRCEGDTLIVCVEDEDRCLVEFRTDCAATEGGTCDPAGPRCVDPPCAGVPAPCALPGRRCDGDVLVECAALPSGCLTETRFDCPRLEDGAVCDPTATPVSCVATPPDPCAGRPDACPVESRSCDGTAELVICAADVYGCLVETRTVCRTGDNPDAFCDTGTLVFCSDGEACAGPDLCTVPGTRCDAVTGELVVCEPDPYDCLRERRIDCGFLTRFGVCSRGGGVSGCAVGTDECANVEVDCRTEGRSCIGADLGICAPDAFGCLELEVVSCGGGGRACDPATTSCR